MTRDTLDFEDPQGCNFTPKQISLTIPPTLKNYERSEVYFRYIGEQTLSERIIVSNTSLLSKVQLNMR